MGRRWQRWRALDSRQRLQLLGCLVGLWLVHASLALAGYARTRRLLERTSQRASKRQATPTEIAEAQALATLAATASRHALGEAACLRRSLLLYGWLRCRGMRPELQLGVADGSGPFQAHAWVELEGIRMLASDAGYRPFVRSAASDQA